MTLLHDTYSSIFMLECLELINRLSFAVFVQKTRPRTELS